MSFLRILTTFLLILAFAQAALASEKSFITKLKENYKGPFERIRWFCNDGTILPAKAGCSKNGGGIQHADWTPEVKELRENGLPIATIFAALNDEDLIDIAQNQSLLPAMLVERQLIAADNGWIYKKAKFYRGALQFEDESRGAKRLLSTMTNQNDWVKKNFLLAREASRLLPLEKNSNAMSEVRGLANAVSDLDSSFLQLRNKIHSIPGLADAEAVRNWAAKKKNKSVKDKSEQLARKIELVFGGNLESSHILDSVTFSPVLAKYEKLYAIVDQLKTAETIRKKLELLSELLLQVRYTAQEEVSPLAAQELLETSIDIEGKAYQYAVSNANNSPSYSRHEALEELRFLTRAVFGTGMISKRAYYAAEAAISRLMAKQKISTENYWKELTYLSNIPVWGADEYAWYFGTAVKKFTELDSLASLFSTDRMRGSMMALYSLKLDKLFADASRLSGMTHEFFGQTIAFGLKALNPGIARGVLVDLEANSDANYGKDSILVVPEILTDLKSVSGIITARAGNSLSHVQLLAANAGIPNVVVNSSIIDHLKNYQGKSLVLAASAGGKVLLEEDSDKWNKILPKSVSNQIGLVELNTEKLELDDTNIKSVSKIDSSDSGKSVGPKAAELGELKNEFPDAVSNALVIPFGVYAEALKIPYRGSSSLREWINRQLKEITEQNLSYKLIAIRNAIEGIQFNQAFKDKLSSAMKKEFGAEGTYGVFVRSDTNVEDLPNFTGAGLNRTVPNVLGFQNILKAILKVWASPFTERAYAWRSKHLKRPQDVYVSVLLHKTVPAEVSGVLITENIENGDRDQFSVAANYGVGGAVAAQDSETVIIDRDSGKVRLLSESTARNMRLINSTGGLTNTEITERRVLSVEQLLRLHKFVKQLYSNFSEFEDKDGNELPFDVEFGFIKDKLHLFQVRPYVKNKNFEFHPFLRSLDKKNKKNRKQFH